LQKSHELDNCGRVANTLMQLRKREALIAAHKGVSIGFAGVNHAELW